MPDVASVLSKSAGDHLGCLKTLQQHIEHASHFLPSQGPITVFVHHNTLHAFENLPFEAAVKEGWERYHCQPYLSEQRYQELLASGRIRAEDLSAVLLEDLGEEADKLIGFMGSRYHLRQGMLRHTLRTGTEAEIRWLMEETEALKRFHPENPEQFQQQMVKDTRHWILLEQQNNPADADARLNYMLADLLKQFGSRTPERWSETNWDRFTLQLLWRICLHGVHGIPRQLPPAKAAVRHRDLLFEATGVDIDQTIKEFLIRFCSIFLDQGFANWSTSDRSLGYFKCFARLYRNSRPLESWLRPLPQEIQRIQQEGHSPLESIDESLVLLGVEEAEREEFITQTLLALPGWAGMLWQMELNADWTVRPAPKGALQEYLAVRLILERLALEHWIRQQHDLQLELCELRHQLQKWQSHTPRVSVEQRAYLIFQLAQTRGWNPSRLHGLTKSEWTQLVREIELFSSLERRRIYHLAYERRYRLQALDAISLHAQKQQQRSQKVQPRTEPPMFQLVTCIDDREESFRRHLEEVAPECQTFGAAGFFAIAMYYQGADEAHFRPLCPNIIKPAHYVKEQAAYSLQASSRQRADARKRLGTATHRWHLQSRSFLGGIVTSLLGSLASVPLVTRILFPRATARWNHRFGRLIQTPPVTELVLNRTHDPAGPEAEYLGYSLEEMVQCVERILRDIGLTKQFARVVIFLGHGSSSLNNPHESAYNCGACSGGRGGPNARAFAQMANDLLVREQLKSRGITIPLTTFFVGGFHNTCDEDVVYFDLDRIPPSHRREFEKIRGQIDEVRSRNAQERCRRFESAELGLSPAQALEHVQARAEDLSQARPEYNHATNAVCVVGRRSRTRGLFMDRRAFLTEYDPTQDDADQNILARILAAAVPVCAGISLEYYFSCVDVVGFGCGSKLPHNIVSLLGVMEGAASDLRTGLSQQMIEIHEPMRILFVIESTPEKFQKVKNGNPVIRQLIDNQWIQLALLSPDSAEILVYEQGQFRKYQPTTSFLAEAESSEEWYQDERGHLGFCHIWGTELAKPLAFDRFPPRFLRYPEEEQQ